MKSSSVILLVLIGVFAGCSLRWSPTLRDSGADVVTDTRDLDADDGRSDGPIDAATPDVLGDMPTDPSTDSPAMDTTSPDDGPAVDDRVDVPSDIPADDGAATDVDVPSDDGDVPTDDGAADVPTDAGTCVRSCGTTMCGAGQCCNGDGRTCEFRVAKVAITPRGTESVHACALMEDHTVFCWGSNLAGQLGYDTGDAGVSARPQLVREPDGGLDRVRDIAVGVDISCAILDDDSLHCWGRDPYDVLDRDPPDGGTAADGGGPGCTVPIEGRTPREPHGVSRFGRVRQIAFSGEHTCVLTAGSGEVLCWGADNGRLGSGTSAPCNVVPTRVARELRTGDSPVRLSGVTQIAIGALHSCALVSSPLDAGARVEVRCWGYNDWGQLGTGDAAVGAIATVAGTAVALPMMIESRPVSISAGASHTCVVLADQSVRCWGANSAGELGTGATSCFYATPVQVSVDTRSVTALAAGNSVTCAAFRGLGADALRCWGVFDTNGSLTWTVDASVPVCSYASSLSSCRGDAGADAGIMSRICEPGSRGRAVGFEETRVRQIAFGPYQTCVVKDDGRLYCWGADTSGILNTRGVAALVPVQIVF